MWPMSPCWTGLRRKAGKPKRRRFRAEGWKWVEITPEASYEALSGYGRQSGKREPLPPKQQKALEKLQQQRDALAEKEEYSDADAAQIDALDAQMQRLRTHPSHGVTAEKTLRLVVSIGPDGTVEITRGLIAPADRKAAKADDIATPKPRHPSRRKRPDCPPSCLRS